MSKRVLAATSAVDLVIATVEPVHSRAGYCFLIKIDMRERHSVVLAAVMR